MGEMIPVRAVFAKKGRAKYISHLDMNRCMQRAMCRAEIPIWYTEGFNPHSYLVFALALSLGYESGCEILDFRLTEDIPLEEVRNRLNQVMPEGLEFVSIQKPIQKPTAIASSEFELYLQSEDENQLTEQLTKFLEQKEIITQKRTKHKGIQEVDIRPQIFSYRIEKAEQGIVLCLNLAAGSQMNLNPSLVLQSFSECNSAAFKLKRTVRKSILCADGTNFE